MREKSILCWFGRILALLWGVWWTFFGIASGIGEGLGVLGTIAHALIPGVILLGSAFVAWRWAKVGGMLLVVEGILVTIVYPIVFRNTPFATVILIWLTMAFPPLLAGGAILSSERGKPEPLHA